MTVPSPEILSYEDIRGIVEEFRQQYWPSGSIPIDVEFIVTSNLLWTSLPFPTSTEPRWVSLGRPIDGLYRSGGSGTSDSLPVPFHPSA